MFLRMTVANNIKTTLPETENAMEYMQNLRDRFRTTDKSLAGKLMSELTIMHFDGTCTMHEHVLEMTNIAAK